MTTREFTFAFELAIGLFALYLLVRRLIRMARSDQSVPPFVVLEPDEAALANTDQPVEIARFRRAEEAEMWAATLRDADINATVRDASVQGRPRREQTIWTAPRLAVLAQDAHRAIEILREAEQGRNAIRDDDAAGE